MKKEIMAYITALIDMNQSKGLSDLWNFVDDFEDEEQNSDGEAIYVKRIVELQEEIEKSERENKCLQDTCSGHRIRIRKLEDINKELDENLVESQEEIILYANEKKELFKESIEFQEENIELKEEIADLKEIRSLTLSTGKELQELRSKLAESERMAEYSSKLWQSTCEKLIKDNDKLQKDLIFWEGNR